MQVDIGSEGGRSSRDVEVDGFVGWSGPSSNVGESSVAVVRTMGVVTVPTKVNTVVPRESIGERTLDRNLGKFQ